MCEDLWPEFIRDQDYVTPRQLAEQQCTALEARTQGKLKGEIVEGSSESSRIDLHVEILAPAIDRRVRLFSLSHERDALYPVSIEPPDITEIPEISATRTISKIVVRTRPHSCAFVWSGRRQMGGERVGRIDT